jgi:hypothetical protein
MGIIRFFKGIYDWWDDLKRLEDISNSELFKVYIWPILTGISAVASGLFQKEAVMWIIMAASLSAMAIMSLIASAASLRDRLTPLNKLTNQVVAQYDLDQVAVPMLGNRQHRRSGASSPGASFLGPGQVQVGVKRQIERAQLGVEITNNSHFPISCILLAAETDIGGAMPPRSQFPKEKTVIPAWSKIRILDDPIDMKNYPCQRLNGNMDMKIGYGVPGKERYELIIKGSVDILMEEHGFVSAIVLGLTEPPVARPLTFAQMRQFNAGPQR